MVFLSSFLGYCIDRHSHIPYQLRLIQEQGGNAPFQTILPFVHNSQFKLPSNIILVTGLFRAMASILAVVLDATTVNNVVKLNRYISVFWI